MVTTVSPWNSLELSKILTGLIMPVVVALVGFYLGQVQKRSTEQATESAELRARTYQVAQKAQAQTFQTGLAHSNRSFAERLQSADFRSRSEMQAPELRWRRALQEENSQLEIALRQADIRRAEEATAADIRRADELHRQEIERERKDSVADFSRSISDRRIRAVLLASALRRHDAGSVASAEQEVLARKARYDESFAQWNTDIQVNMFRIRRVLDTKEYTFLENVVEQRLSAGLFAATDVCLTRAYDVSATGGKAGPLLDECRMPVLLKSTLDCGYTISDILFRMASSQVNFAELESEINMRCPERSPV